jgi:hypothetical protein
MGRVDSRAKDSALTKDESVWIAYKVVNPKDTARLNDTELANPETSALAPSNIDANGAAETRVVKTVMIILSNLAILNALLASSRSSWSSPPWWLCPKAPHHIRPLSSAIDR